jgi:hypothetical protein
MNAIITALIAATGIGALLNVITYGFFGRPWIQRVGRATVSLHSGIFAVMMYALERRLFGTVSPIPSGQFFPAFVAYGLITGVEAYCWSGLWLLLVSRRGGVRSALRIRRSRRVALESDEPLHTIIGALDLLSDAEFDLVIAAVRPR